VGVTEAGAGRQPDDPSLATETDHHSPTELDDGVIDLAQIMQSSEDDYDIDAAVDAATDPGIPLSLGEEELIDFGGFEWEDSSDQLENIGPSQNVEDSTPAPDVQPPGEEFGESHLQGYGDVRPRDNVTDCIVCLCPLVCEGNGHAQLWVCSYPSCRQPLHRNCAESGYEHDTRCPNCRREMEFNVSDDEVLVVGHIPPPPTCQQCHQVIRGIVLEGSQCSHTFDYDCLVLFNAEVLQITATSNFACPACRYPFPVGDGEEDAHDGMGVSGDHAYEYDTQDESQRAAAAEIIEINSNDSTPDQIQERDDEYHRSDFASDSSDADDEDYSPSDAVSSS
jgi:hypothetical protein